MDNARERRFGNGREPRVLWKNHADFIGIPSYSLANGLANGGEAQKGPDF